MNIDDFLVSRCEFDDKSKVAGAVLYEAYLRWSAGLTIPLTRRRFTAAVTEKAARYGVRYGPQRFRDGRVARGFAGMRLCHTLDTQLIPTHIPVGHASRIAGTTSATIRNWIDSGRLPGTLRESERKTLVSLRELYAYLGIPPTRLQMAAAALPSLENVDGDMLRAAILSPHSEWADRLRRLLDALKAKNDPRLGIAITLLENIT